MANGITVVGIVGLVAGWLVSGYQRVGEKLTEERGAAYGSLLSAADAARRPVRHGSRRSARPGHRALNFGYLDRATAG